MKNRTKTISLLMAVCMMITLLPAVAMATQATSVVVGGVELNNTNKWYVNGADGAPGTTHATEPTEWNARFENGTLTLNNATITDYSTEINGEVYGIEYGYSAPLTINLIGDNTIIGQQGTPNSNTGSGGKSFGIWSVGSLTFNGSGSLTVSSGNATGDGSWSVAIYAHGNITVDNSCTITASCGTAKDKEAAIFPTGSHTLSFIQSSSTITASESADGSNPVSYNEINLRSYKYLRIEPGTAGGTSGGSTTPTTYTVTFDANGGEGIMAAVSGVYGEYTLPDNGFTPPEGKKFRWWWVNENSFHYSDEVIQVTDNVTLKAVWTPLKTYSVSFSAGVAQGYFTGSMEPQSFTEGVAQAISSNAFVRDGYEFTGWVDEYNNSYTEGQTIALDGSKVPENDDGLTLTAQWKEDTPGTTDPGGTTPTTYEKEYNNFIVTGPVNATGDGVEGIESTANGLDIKTAGEYTVKNVKPSDAHSQMIRVLVGGVKLTLAGVNVDKNSDNALRLEADTHIVLENQNTLDGNGNGISAESNGKPEYTVTFSGSGSLTAVGTGNGIHGHVVIESGDVTCEGGGNGIHGNVTLKNGKLTCEGTGNGIEGTVTVNGGELNSTGEERDGICGNVTINGGSVYCEGKSNDDERSFDDLSRMNLDGGNGIEGNVTMSGGTLTAYSSANDAETNNYIAQGGFFPGLNGKLSFVNGFDPSILAGKNPGSAVTVTLPADGWIKDQYVTLGGRTPATTTYTVTFDANGGSGTMEAVRGVSGHYILPANGFTVPDGKQFRGWKVGNGEYAEFDTIDVTSDITVIAVWDDAAPNPPEEDATIEGTITSPYGNISVELVDLDGNKHTAEVSEVTKDTNNTGNQYSCTYTATAPKGYNYNVVVTAKQESPEPKSVTVTELVYLDTDKKCDIKLPSAEKNSIVDDNSENFNAIVGGVEKIAGGDTTDLNITITLEINDVTANDAGADVIKKKAVDMDLDFVDFSLFKQVGDDEPKDIGSENTVLLTIMLKYDTNRRNIRVFRYHDGVDELKSINENNQSEGFWIGNGYIGIRAYKFSTYAVAYDSPSPGGAPGTVDPGTSSGGYYGPSIWYIGGNTFGTSTSQVPTSVEIDGVAVPFTMNGSNIVVGCVAPDADRIRVTWGSVSNSIGFTPDAAASCAQVFVPKTGDVSVMAFALMAVVAAAGAMGKK